MTSISTVNPLKPERIGLPAALTARSPLKPERIGQRLQKLPGWELLSGEAQATVVWRGFRFHRTETAQAFVRFAAEMARDHGQRPVISQVWNAVTVVLPGEGAVTEADLDFAESLMLLPQVGSGAGEQTPPVQGPSQDGKQDTVPPVVVAS
jgi:pterin-4a-carbinolamine dehydratase